MAKQEVREECVIPMPINGSSLAGVSPEFRQLLEQMIASQSNPELRALLGHKLGATSVSNKWKGELESISRDLRSVLKSIADVAVTCIFIEYPRFAMSEYFQDHLKAMGRAIGLEIGGTFAACNLVDPKKDEKSLREAFFYRNGHLVDLSTRCTELREQLLLILKRKMQLDWLVEQGSYQNSVSSIAAKFARGAKLSKTKKDILTFSQQWNDLKRTIPAVINLFNLSLSFSTHSSYSPAEIIEEKVEDPETALLRRTDDVLDTVNAFVKVIADYRSQSNLETFSNFNTYTTVPDNPVISAPRLSFNNSINTDAWGGLIFCTLMLGVMGGAFSKMSAAFSKMSNAFSRKSGVKKS